MKQLGQAFYDDHTFDRLPILGRRITENRSGTVTDLYYSAAGQVVEERVSGVAKYQYIWSPVYVNALVLHDELNSGGSLVQRLYVQLDANWNVTALVDTSGTVQERYVYDPYGAQTVLTASWGSRSSSSFSFVVGFQGGRQESITGLIHFNARDFSPALQRWVSVDPALTGMNFYVGMGNNPTNAVDPWGLQPAQFEEAKGRGDLKEFNWKKKYEKGFGNGDVTFTLTESWLGTIPQQGADEPLIGMVLSFQVKSSVPCEQLKIVQVARFIRWDAKSSGFHTDNRFYDAAVNALPNKRAQIGDPKAHSAGWFVDTKSEDVGWYQDFKGGTYWDGPARSANGTGGFEFYTAAFAVNKGKPKFLGAVKWGFFINGDGDVTGIDPKFVDKAPPELGDAIGRFNAVVSDKNKLPAMEGVDVRYDYTRGVWGTFFKGSQDPNATAPDGMTIDGRLRRVMP